MEEKKRARERLLAAIGTAGPDRDDALWDALICWQGEPFLTAKGLVFTYSIRARRDGAIGGEMFISRKEKSITQSTVFMAFHRALELGGAVPGPKKLGTFGASYLYPIFIRLGVISQAGPDQETLFQAESGE